MSDDVFLLGLQVTQQDSAYTPTQSLYDRVGHNTGNLAFHFAIDKQLGGGLKSVDWSATAEVINGGGRVSILPCANQIGAHADYGGLAAKFNLFNVPIVAIGLGAQAGTDGKIPVVPQGTIDWVKSIAQHAPSSAPNIAVRGDFTLEVLAHYNLAEKAKVLGCPTLFINPDPKLGQTIASNLKDPKRIAVAAGHQKWKHLARIEASLTSMVKATGGSYVGQSPLEMVQLTRGEAAELDLDSLAACRDYACPEMDLAEFVHWTKLHGNVFFDIPAWMEHYRRFDFVIGTRIHGIMLALQAGVPGLCIAHDSRTLELCTTMKVPYILAKDVQQGIRRKDLLKLFNFDAAAFDVNRKRLATSYVEFLKSNGITPAHYLVSLAA